MRTGFNTRKAKDADVVLGNGIASAGVIASIALAVIGLLVGFEVLVENNANAFQDGMLWMGSGLVTAIASNVFRREHHVVDPDEEHRYGGTEYGATGRTTTSRDVR
jgi:hypothetical protein